MTRIATRYKNKTEKELDITETIFILCAIFSKIGIIENILFIKRKNGVPGGCGTCNAYPAAVNSPTSQNETDGCEVKNKTSAEIKKTTAPIIM